jgi:CubicO group peptidase (beta-lactamase class C family)
MPALRLLLRAVIVFFLFVPSCRSASQNPQYAKDVEERIARVINGLSGWVQIKDSANTWTLEERMKHYQVPGLSIAVIHDYKIEWARGYGVMDATTKNPITVETLFQAASISKSLNAVGVLKLVQDKKLDLYADINTYLHTWKFPYDSVSKGRKITTANLLSHTAGLTIHGFPGYEKGDPLPSIVQILDGKPPANTKAVRSQFQPGLRHEYSGGGTTISQLIVMDITHQTYDQWMWENVLKPLGMTMSSYEQPPAQEKLKFLATGYYPNGAEVERKYNVYPEQAAAGLWTNPTDLAKYIIETQLSLQGKSAKVLSQQMTQLRLTPYIDSSAALGVFIEKKGDEKYFGHSGANSGFLSIYTGSFSTGNGVVIMINSENGAIRQELINSVAQVYAWKDYYKPVTKETIPAPESVVGAYKGMYFFQGDTATLTGDRGSYWLQINKGDKMKVHFSSADEFFTEDIPLVFKFEKDEKGTVTGFYFMQGAQKRVVRKL